MSELEERLPTTLSFSPDRVAIVEELIDGHQGTCEGIFVDGKVALAVLTDRVTAPSPYVVTAGHLVPTLLTDDAGSKVISLIADVFERLQIRNAMFDCDYVFDDKQDKAYLLELTPRLGGNSLTRLVRTALGVDMAEAAISLACGRQLHLLATGARPTPTAQLILGVRRAGLLTYDELGAASLGRESWVHSLSFDMAIGRPVQAFINGRTRVGEATIVAATREELNARVEEFYSRLRLDIQLEPASR